MDLDEFKDAITCTDPRFYDWKFGAKVDVPLVKILPECLKTEEDLAKLIRYELDEKAGIQKFAKTAMECYKEDCRRADERARKHRIFIACPSYRDARKYVDDLVHSLRLLDIIVARVDMVNGEVETRHVIAKMIPPTMCRNGLRCDECFGFPYEEAILLKRRPISGFERLTSVPGYIQQIEKEKMKEMEDAMSINIDARKFVSAIMKNPTAPNPTIKDVIFNDPATIVMWSDGTKTVVKAEGDDFDPEKGLAMAISKKNLGNKYDYYNTFKHWLKKYYKDHPEKDAAWEVPAKPVQAAYKALINIMSTKGTKLNTKTALEEAVEEAIGFIGQALDD